MRKGIVYLDQICGERVGYIQIRDIGVSVYPKNDLDSAHNFYPMHRVREVIVETENVKD